MWPGQPVVAAGDHWGRVNLYRQIHAVVCEGVLWRRGWEWCPVRTTIFHLLEWCPIHIPMSHVLEWCACVHQLEKTIQLGKTKQNNNTNNTNVARPASGGWGGGEVNMPDWFDAVLFLSFPQPHWFAASVKSLVAFCWSWTYSPWERRYYHFPKPNRCQYTGEDA